MSIKNRYNHTVSQPDSTLNNNLDLLYVGLQKYGAWILWVCEFI